MSILDIFLLHSSFGHSISSFSSFAWVSWDYSSSFLPRVRGAVCSRVALRAVEAGVVAAAGAEEDLGLGLFLEYVVAVGRRTVAEAVFLVDQVLALELAVEDFEVGLPEEVEDVAERDGLFAGEAGEVVAGLFLGDGLEEALGAEDVLAVEQPVAVFRLAFADLADDRVQLLLSACTHVEA